MPEKPDMKFVIRAKVAETKNGAVWKTIGDISLWKQEDDSHSGTLRWYAAPTETFRLYPPREDRNEE